MIYSINIFHVICTLDFSSPYYLDIIKFDFISFISKAKSINAPNRNRNFFLPFIPHISPSYFSVCAVVLFACIAHVPHLARFAAARLVDPDHVHDGDHGCVLPVPHTENNDGRDATRPSAPAINFRRENLDTLWGGGVRVVRVGSPFV